MLWERFHDGDSIGMDLLECQMQMRIDQVGKKVNAFGLGSVAELLADRFVLFLDDFLCIVSNAIRLLVHRNISWLQIDHDASVLCGQSRNLVLVRSHVPE